MELQAPHHSRPDRGHRIIHDHGPRPSLERWSQPPQLQPKHELGAEKKLMPRWRKHDRDPFPSP